MHLKKPLLIFSLLCLIIIIVGVFIQLNTTEKPKYFFFVHMIAPTSNPVRMQYAQIMEGELPKIGIGTELDLISWAAFGPRCTDQEVGQYNEGGYDISFFGMSLGTPHSSHGGDFLGLYGLEDVYGPNAIPPSGFNVMYWSPETGKNYNNYRADESNSLIQRIANSMNLTEVKQDLLEWQKIWYDVMPNVLIYNQYNVQAISTGLFGYDPVSYYSVSYPFSSLETIWTDYSYPGTTGQVVLATSTAGDTFNPMLTTDVFDLYYALPPTDGLVGYTPSRELVLPSGVHEQWMTDHFGTTAYSELYPRIAVALGEYSADCLEYEIDVRDDVRWHDGHFVDAWDVAFSFQVPLIPDIGASKYSRLMVPFGLDDKVNHHGNYSFLVTDENNDGFYEHIKFYFNRSFPPFERDDLGISLLPEHILGDPANHGFNVNGDFDPNNKWQVAPRDWQYHSTTTGCSDDTGGYKGPIGCGPVVFIEYNFTTGIADFRKFENIRWDNNTGQWVSAPGISHWNIDNLNDMPNNVKTIVASKDDALADMKAGEVNILDPQFTLADILEELHTESTISPVLSPQSGWQGIYFNPKFVQDDIRHLNKKGVRHAISHVVPREDIIQYLLKRLGFPAYTPVPITFWAAISDRELLDFKKTLQATDGTTPEADATTAYDDYSIEKAFIWLGTEGYNIDPWRHYSETTVKPGIPGFGYIMVTVISITFSICKSLKRKG